MPTGKYIRTEEHKKNLSKSHIGKSNNLGKHWKISQEKKKNMFRGKGENNHSWKGNKVKYFGLHMWVAKELGKPKYCAYCRNEKLNHRQYHWANISHAYKRELSDWIRLCAKCHKAYDMGRIKLN